MSDLNKARELEKRRYYESIERLNLKEQEQIRRTNADFAARGLLHSGPRLIALTKARIDKLQALIDARVEIRKDLARSFPELGHDDELEALSGQIMETLRHAGNLPHEALQADGAAQKAVKAQLEREIDGLRARAKSRIEILKLGVALKLHTNDAPAPAVTVTTGGGHAILNVGNIYGNVQQVIGSVSEGGHRELADLLQQLAKAINDAEELGDERAAYLEQVQFIAKQVAEPVEARQSSVVKGLVAGLRARLADAAHFSHILELVGPALAAHFGFSWPYQFQY